MKTDSNEVRIFLEARTWLEARIEFQAQTRRPSLDTHLTYEREFNRLLERDREDPWKAALATRKKSTFYKRRAAILHHCESVIRSKFQLLSQLRSKGLHDPISQLEWHREIESIDTVLSVIKAAPQAIEIKDPIRRATKRKSLRNLPENWRERLFNRMPMYRAPIAIISICGCRPAELAKGVEIWVEVDELKVKIMGAKITENSGQEWRVLSWKLPSESQLVELVARLAQEAPFPERRVIVKLGVTPSVFSSAVRAAGERAFPDHPETITPYSIRHQVASDMKAAGFGDEISQALGHAVDATRTTYGSYQNGQRSKAFSYVEAARPVKQVRQPVDTQGTRPRPNC